MRKTLSLVLFSSFTALTICGKSALGAEELFTADSSERQQATSAAAKEVGDAQHSVYAESDKEWHEYIERFGYHADNGDGSIYFQPLELGPGENEISFRIPILRVIDEQPEPKQTLPDPSVPRVVKTMVRAD